MFGMSASMKLSILDVVPVISGVEAGESLRHAPELAQLGDALGYERLWYAEHHNIRSIASAAPELLIANAASATSRIRLGSGGVMLPNHAPLRVVEQYKTLEALHPGRIDLGIGRAAGTDPLTAEALGTWSGSHFSNKMSELLAFAHGGFAASHPYAQITVTPEGGDLPPLWMLGSSGGSAELAGQIGAGYGFAGHFSPTPAAPAVDAYRRTFKPSDSFPEPRVILALTVVCAETEAEAVELSSSLQMNFLDLHQGKTRPLRTPAEARDEGWRPELRDQLGPMGQLLIAGTLDQVANTLRQRALDAGGVDEIMVMTITHDSNAQKRSYELLAELL
ncbi:MAG: luciferase family oxidoreductase group 1 [Polyangiales bacterium]